MMLEQGFDAHKVSQVMARFVGTKKGDASRLGDQRQDARLRPEEDDVSAIDDHFMRKLERTEVGTIKKNSGKSSTAKEKTLGASDGKKAHGDILDAFCDKHHIDEEHCDAKTVKQKKAELKVKAKAKERKTKVLEKG